MIGEGKSKEAVIPLDNTLTKYLAEALQKVGSIGTRISIDKESINDLKEALKNNASSGVVVNFYPQQMTTEEIDNAFNYINTKCGIII